MTRNELRDRLNTWDVKGRYVWTQRDLSIATQPARPGMLRQRIRLEVANVPAHTGGPLPLRRNCEGRADSYGGADNFLVTTQTGFVTKKIQDYGVQDVETLRNDLLDRLSELINSAPIPSKLRMYLI